MDQYKVLGRVGEGAHGLVLRAKHRVTGKEVALKKLLLRRPQDELPLQIAREIKTMQQIDCRYVVPLLDVFPAGLSFVLVLEFMPRSLTQLIADVESPLAEPHIKTLAQQLFRGIAHLHSIGIMHRDLKPANLLISSSGELRIADLGQARIYHSAQSRPYSHQVATRWYRAPELLYGARFYTHAVDMWAAGCVLAEMINRSPLFSGESDIDQLCVVLRGLGSPSARDWPELLSLPDYNKITFPLTPPLPLERLLPDAAPHARELVGALVKYNPAQRLTAQKVLSHAFFFTPPVPLPLPPVPPSQHPSAERSRGPSSSSGASSRVAVLDIERSPLSALTLLTL